MKTRVLKTGRKVARAKTLIFQLQRYASECDAQHIRHDNLERSVIHVSRQRLGRHQGPNPTHVHQVPSANRID